MKLPNCKKPCKDCPFRKDSNEGWLGEQRITEIMSQQSFVCHKTVDYENGSLEQRLQCAGHMTLLEDKNEFYRLANGLGMDLGLSGREFIFDNEQDCLTHHSLIKETPL